MISLELFKHALVAKDLYLNRLNEKQLEKLRARIEILREGIFTSPSDQTLERGLGLLVKDVSELLYNDSISNPVSEKELSVVTSLCNSLVEISEFTSKNNRGIYFSSQRYLFNIAFHLFSYPNYNELFHDSWGMKGIGQVDITQILYDLAERQNMDPRPTGDVTAEGGFCDNIFNGIYYKSESIRPSQDGLKVAFQLWKDLAQSAAKINPSRLKALYENLRDSATHNYIDDIDRPYIYPEPVWFQDWLLLFSNLKPSVYSLQSYRDAYNSLHGLPANGDWDRISAEANGSEYQEISPWNLEDVEAACIQSTALNSIGHLFGVIAIYKRWHELKECWYSSQPIDAGAHFCSHDFFNRNISALCKWMTIYIPSENDFSCFVGRHSLSKNIYKTCLVLIADELNSKETEILQMHGNSPDEIPRLIAVVKGLLLNVALTEDIYVISAFEWGVDSKGLRSKVESVLNRTLDSLDSRLKIALLACTHDSKSPEDLELKYQAWGKTNESFIKELDPTSWGDEVISENALAEMIHLKFERKDIGACYYLSKKKWKNTL